MPSYRSFERVALMSGDLVRVRTPQKRQVVGYSEVASSETPLLLGVRPVSLLEPRTGSLLVGERQVGGRPSETERLVAGSLRFVQTVASALPVDEEDERIIDELMAKRAAGRTTRPLRRREGDSR